MNEHTVTSEELKALQALAKLNIKISEARETLEKLYETETEYLIERERKAVERINKL